MIRHILVISLYPLKYKTHNDNLCGGAECNHTFEVIKNIRSQAGFGYFL